MTKIIFPDNLENSFHSLKPKVKQVIIKGCSLNLIIENKEESECILTYQLQKAIKQLEHYNFDNCETVYLLSLDNSNGYHLCKNVLGLKLKKSKAKTVNVYECRIEIEFSDFNEKFSFANSYNHVNQLLKYDLTDSEIKFHEYNKKFAHKELMELLNIIKSENNL